MSLRPKIWDRPGLGYTSAIAEKEVKEMSNPEHQNAEHDMQLVTTDSTGAEEWYCPTCGRRFLLRWPPNYEKVVLEPGDEQAIHNGSKGGLKLQPPQMEPQGSREPDDVVFSDELRAALEEALKDIDLDDWPDPDPTE
jgi:hypothetical protein